MADLTTLQGWLTEAENARHQLAMGKQVVEVWRDGRRLTYRQSSLNDLNGYIDNLTAQIARLEDEQNGTSFARRRSIGVIFGG